MHPGAAARCYDRVDTAGTDRGGKTPSAATAEKGAEQKPADMPIARERLLHRATVVPGAVALTLMVVNAVLLVGNQQRQGEVNGRQAFINQSARLARLNQELVNTLAQVAVKRKDDALRNLLTANGITINANGTPPTPPRSPSPARDRRSTMRRPTGRRRSRRGGGDFATATSPISPGGVRGGCF